jgi:hypothetical protein
MPSPSSPETTSTRQADDTIETARDLLLCLHLESMTNAIFLTDPVKDLMRVLDEAIFAWDSAQPAKDESRWQPYIPTLPRLEESHD